MERCIFKYLYNDFISNNIIASVQFGFRRGDSTVIQLVDVTMISTKL